MRKIRFGLLSESLQRAVRGKITFKIPKEPKYEQGGKKFWSVKISYKPRGLAKKTRKEVVTVSTTGDEPVASGTVPVGRAELFRQTLGVDMTPIIGTYAEEEIKPFMDELRETNEFDWGELIDFLSEITDKPKADVLDAIDSEDWEDLEPPDYEDQPPPRRVEDPPDPEPDPPGEVK